MAEFGWDQQEGGVAAEEADGAAATQLEGGMWPEDQWQYQQMGGMPWMQQGMMPGGWEGGGNYYGGPGPMAAAGPPRRPQKERFCATFPDVGRCRHGSACSFAHTREEVCAPLLSVPEEQCTPAALTEEFFTERFKTLWCPIGAQHDWQACMYAHTYQDVRRPPAIGYGHQLCPYWNKKDTSLPYSQRCPLGPRCPYSHGAKEQLYHPGYFRTLLCRDLQRRRCPRGHLCVFFHRQADCRTVPSEEVDYAAPLPKEAIPPEWVEYFMNPPRFQENYDGMMPMAAMGPPPAAMPPPPARGSRAVQRPGGAAGSSARAAPPAPIINPNWAVAAKPGGDDSPRTATSLDENCVGVEAAEEALVEDTASSQDGIIGSAPPMAEGAWSDGYAAGLMAAAQATNFGGGFQGSFMGGCGGSYGGYGVPLVPYPAYPDGGGGFGGMPCGGFGGKGFGGKGKGKRS